MVKITASTIFLKLFADNVNNSEILIRLLSVSKLNDLLIIFELCKNILLNNIKISQHDFNKLRDYEKELIFLSEKHKSYKKSEFVKEKYLYV